MCVTMEMNLLLLPSHGGKCVSFQYNGLFLSLCSKCMKESMLCPLFRTHFRELILKLKAQHVRYKAVLKVHDGRCSRVLLRSQKSGRSIDFHIKGGKYFRKKINIPLFSVLILMLCGKTLEKHLEFVYEREGKPCVHG